MVNDFKKILGIILNSKKPLKSRLAILTKLTPENPKYWHALYLVSLPKYSETEIAKDLYRDRENFKIHYRKSYKEKEQEYIFLANLFKSFKEHDDYDDERKVKVRY